MSSEILYASRALVTPGGLLQLEVKSFSTNVSPKPTFAERKHTPFEPLGKAFSYSDPELVALRLESLAQSYDSGCLKENYDWITGLVAYRRWAKRIRKVLPELEIRLPRESRCAYSVQPALVKELQIPALAPGDALNLECARKLTRAGVFPKMRDQHYGRTVYLAFVYNDLIYFSNSRGASTGWATGATVVGERVEGRSERRAIADCESGTHAVRRVESGAEDLFLCDYYQMKPALEAKSKYGEDFMRFDAADAAEAAVRLAEHYPDARWEVVTSGDVETAIAGALLIAV
jgi:hypothetical protein